MSQEQSSHRSGGCGFFGLLALLFIGLKLGGFITWSWWWVLAPLWIPAAIVLLVIAFCLLMALVIAVVSK
jgi:hypothetical protein